MKVLILAIFAVSCASTTNATKTTSTYPSDDYNPLEEVNTCGFKYGFHASKGQFPHVAFLKSRNAYKVQYCSGTVIHPKWVLTSAYCTLADSTFEITLGALVPFDEEDPDRVVLQSELFFIHPEYLPRYKEPKNDVALIKLPRPVKSADVIPMAMKKRSTAIKGTIAGWGESGYETLSFIDSITVCEGPCTCFDSDSKRMESCNAAKIESDFFCGQSLGAHFCFLHNGAGLVVNGVLVAVMSMRCYSHCRDHEAIFTNLYKHWQWISDTVDEEYKPEIYGACSDIPSIISGVYLIQPNQDMDPFVVHCDLRVDGNKWTVIQQRFNKSVDFYRNYANYTKGFGPIDGNHWLGLEKIHQLTKNGDHELRVEVQLFNSTRAYAQYRMFKVDSEETGFNLTIYGYGGTAGNSLTHNHSVHGMLFSTFDNDQDTWDDNCAAYVKGAFWFNACGYSNLNSIYYDSHVDAIDSMSWGYDFKAQSLKTVRMLIRRKSKDQETINLQGGIEIK